MPRGTLLSELEETEVPWPQAEEVIKMKILSAPDRWDRNRAMGDLDDVMALLKKDVSVTYRDDAEKAAIKVALGMFLPIYVAKEREWSAEQWKTKLGLA